GPARPAHLGRNGGGAAVRRRRGAPRAGRGVARRRPRRDAVRGRGAGPDRGGPRPVRPGGGAAGPAVRAGGRAARRPRAGLRRPRRAGGVVAAAREDEMTRPAETAPPASMSRYVSLAVTACLAAVAGLAFHRVFGFGPVVPVVAVAAVAPTVLCALLSGPRKSGSWPLWISLVLTVIEWGAPGAVTVLRPAPGAGTLPQAPREGVRGAWKSVLATLLPGTAEPAKLG